MERTDKDPSAYLASLPEGDREPMQQLDRMISDIMSGLPKMLWEGKFWGGTEQTIIGYGDIKNDKTDWFVVGLALQKNYISIYVVAVQDGEYVAEKYGSRLGKAKVGKSSISFKSIEDVDLDALAAVLQIAREQVVSV